MGCKELRETIDGAEYYAVQWSASKALKMKFRLIQLFGDAFSKLAPLANEKTANKEEVLMNFVSGLFVKATPDEVFDLLKLVVSTATRNGKRIDDAIFEEAYSNNLMEFYKAVVFMLKLNYSDFFGGKLASLLSTPETGKPVTTEAS